MDMAMTMSTRDCFACPCLNVTIVADIGRIATDEEGDQLEHDVTLLPGSSSQITVSQPLLTARHMAGAASLLTTLVCLNCGKAVYTVDKIMARPQPSGKTTVGFGQSALGNDVPSSSSSTNKTGHMYTSSGDAHGSSSKQDVVEEDVPRPDPASGTLVILTGNLRGSRTISRMAASETFSKTFGLRIEEDAVEGEGGPSGDDNKAMSAEREQRTTSTMRKASRSKSPLNSSLHVTAAAEESSSSVSPSPARKNKSRALVLRTEEEDGDDLDTLHLLENLLPTMPSSVLDDSLNKSAYRQQGANRAASPRRPTQSSYFPQQSQSPSQKRLQSQLDSIALAELKTHHEAAQREVYDLLKIKRKELSQIQEQIQKDAVRLVGRRSRSSSKEATHRVASLDVPTSRRTSREAAPVSDLDKAKDSGSPLFERRRPLLPMSSDMMRTSSSQSGQGEVMSLQGSGAATSGSIAMPGRAGVPTTSGVGPSIMKGGSYLSASFAMRGRDLPQEKPSHTADKQSAASKEDEEEWYAQKRRLRERYPHGDHSALPSAVNSDDEGDIEIKKIRQREEEEEEEGEEEERGRGRGRGRARGPAPDTSEKSSTKEHQAEDQVKRKQSSVLPRLESKSSSSSDELSRSVNTKKGALKASTPMKKEDSSRGKGTPSSEKKVAFAMSTKRAATMPAEVTRENIDEGVDAVFEIDEEIEGEGASNASDISLDPRTVAMQLQNDSVEAPKAEDSSHPKGRDMHGRVEDRPEVHRGSVAQSLPSVGSFSAMAHSENLGRVDEDGDYELLECEDVEPDDFDPASLRLSGETVYSSELGLPLRPSGSATTSITTAATQPDRKAFVSADATSMFGSRPQSVRKPSFDLASALQAGFPTLPEERSSTIGFRVAVGEAEARLSGLLAPNVPSHRNLWASSDSRKPRLIRKESAKYKLKGAEGSEEDFAEQLQEAEEEEEPAWQSRLRKSSIHSNSSSTTSTSGNGGLDAFARSVPIGMTGKLQSMRRTSVAMTNSSSTMYDGNSGFDLEPKTSLPYQEKLLTPSLRKATRHLTTPTRLAPRSSLATIRDASEGGSAGNNPITVTKEKTEEHHVGQEQPLVETQGLGVRDEEQSNHPVTIMRGFQTLALPSETASMPTSTQSTPLLGSKGNDFEDVRPSRRLTARPAYVQPPPPSTYELRLQPNEQNRPREIRLQQAALDGEFAAREAEEQEEDQDTERDLKFMHTLEQLKLNKRTGWLHHRVAHPESIADHMYRMALLSMLLPNEDLDIGKCVQLCLVHDIAEALVGDLTPLDGVSKDEKLQREKEAVLYLVHDLLGGSAAALRLERIWFEYEERTTKESKAVKDLDRFELCLQAVEYERRYNTTDLQPFFDGSLGFITHPRVRRWGRQLAKEREKLWEQTKYEYQQTIPSEV